MHTLIGKMLSQSLPRNQKRFRIKVPVLFQIQFLAAHCPADSWHAGQGGENDRNFDCNNFADQTWDMAPFKLLYYR